MAVLIDGVTTAVDLATATAFEIYDITSITADYMLEGEVAIVHRLGPSGDYVPLTNKEGTVYLSARPNTVVIDAPGWYKVTKTATENEVYIGY